MLSTIIKLILNKLGYRIISNKDWMNKMENLIVEASNEELIELEKINKISLTSQPNKWSLLQSLKHVKDNKIDGDIVETGVFKGANLILINNFLNKYHINKKKNITPVYCALDDVKNNIKKYSDNNLNKITFVKGKVEDTLILEKNLPSKISILRLDTDFYESVKISLEILYPRLVSGGVLIIDDYGHFKGAKTAVDNFFKDKKNIWMHRVDYTCRLILKP